MNIGNVVGNVGNSVRERRKNKHKFRGTKAFKAKEVRKYFANPKIEYEVFG